MTEKTEGGMSEPTLYNHVFSHYSFKSMFSISVYSLPIRTKRFVFKVTVYTETSVEFSDQKQLLAYANARETPMHIQNLQSLTPHRQTCNDH